MTAPRSGWSWALARCSTLLWVLTAPLAAQARPPRVALVLDSDSPRFHPLVEAFQREVLGFFRTGEIVLLPPVAGDGTGSGVGRVLDRALEDSSVSVIVTLGSIGSHLLARSGTPPKPAIAGVVIDASWQGIPQKEGTSGIRGLTYVDESFSVGSTLLDFHRLIPFRKLTALIDKDVLKDIPQLRANATSLVRSAGAEVAIVPSGSTAAEVLAALPAGTDAVYLTPLPAMSD